MSDKNQYPVKKVMKLIRTMQHINSFNIDIFIYKLYL